MTDANQQFDRPEKLDPKKVAEAMRQATPVSAFDQAMEKARGFHQYYEGVLSPEPLHPLRE